MDRVTGRSNDEAISIMDEYIRYMVERINLSLVNMSRKSGITTGELVDRLVEDEMDITSLEGDVTRLNGVVNGKVNKTDVEDSLSTTSINPVQNKIITTELNKKFNTADIDDALDSSSTDPVQNKVITKELETKVRGKPFTITHTGSCTANTDNNLGDAPTLFDITEPVLGVTLKNITDSTNYDSEGSVYIDENEDVIYHSKIAITDPVLTGIVFY